MNNSGTFEGNDGLSVTMSEEDQFDALVNAVSSGDSATVDAIFSTLPAPDPDADDGEEDTAGQPNTSTDATNQTDTTDTHSTDDAEPASNRDTTQESQDTSPASELAALKAELQAAKSALGRVPAMQSQLNQLQRELKVKAAVEAIKPPTPAAEDPDVVKLKERIAALKEIDEDTAGILEALLARQAAPAQTQEAPQDINAIIRQATEEALLEQEYNKVVEAHADAPQIFTSIHWELWKNTLTQEQRDWAESTDSSKVVHAVSAFKNFVNNFGQAPAPAATNTEEEVDVTRAARQRKLTNSATTQSNAVVKSATVQDEEAMFNEFYAQALKEQGL